MSTPVSCPYCGDASDIRAPDCPKCGRPLRGDAAPAAPKKQPIRISAADVVTEAPLQLASFEELGVTVPVQQAVEAELRDGEKIAWLGRTSRDPKMYSGGPLGAKLIGATLLGFGILIWVGAYFLFASFHQPPPMAVWGVVAVFSLAAVGMGYVVLTGDGSKAHRVYVLTNRRALIVQVQLFNQVVLESYYPNDLLGITVKVKPGVTGGDVVFGQRVGKFGAVDPLANAQGLASKHVTVPFGFLLVDRARAVESLIRQTLLERLEQKLDREP